MHVLNICKAQFMNLLIHNRLNVCLPGSSPPFLLLGWCIATLLCIKVLLNIYHQTSMKQAPGPCVPSIKMMTQHTLALNRTFKLPSRLGWQLEATLATTSITQPILWLNCGFLGNVGVRFWIGRSNVWNKKDKRKGFFDSGVTLISDWAMIFASGTEHSMVGCFFFYI